MFCDTCGTFGLHTTDDHQRTIRAEYETARKNYTDPPADWDRDDIRWAYEAMKRAEHKLRSFDVV